MDEQQYEQYLLHCSIRNKMLNSYEKFVHDRLSQYPDTSTAQIHDWLKEHHPDFPQVSPRTVYNFVMYVRQKHNIPVVPRYREYFPVEELPYGEQAQVDFGEYNMQLSNGKRKKVKFLAMVLSRSRMKHVWFLDKPFTSETAVLAHEKAFEFFKGIPKTIVYDQDRTMIVDENIGDIILTSTFGQYSKSRSFKLHFCRKADPESKGKIENVIQYVKKNFLYNRTYHDIETLNDQAIAWMGRTANSLEHNYTKKVPQKEFLIEKQYLAPYTPLTTVHKDIKIHLVRKTNVIAYKSNFYTLPEGTYQGSQTQVIVNEDEGHIHIFNLKNEPICTHPLSTQKGQTIINSNHRRDKSKSIDDMIAQTTTYFTNKTLALEYLTAIRKENARYTRDYLQAMLKVLANGNKQAADKTLEFSIKNNTLKGSEWVNVYHVFDHETVKPETPKDIVLLDKANLEKANEAPQTSDIETYEKIINHKSSKP
jgi:transposase